VLETLENRYGSYGLEAIGGREAVENRVRSEDSPSTLARADALGREIEEALRKPR
jgi:hypothetical protein